MNVFLKQIELANKLEQEIGGFVSVDIKAGGVNCRSLTVEIIRRPLVDVQDRVKVYRQTHRIDVLHVKSGGDGLVVDVMEHVAEELKEGYWNTEGQK